MIADRLRALRKEHGLSKRGLVSKLPLNYSTYANYESGFREPNSEILQMLARHFGVSLDYLLGVSENRRKADEIAILSESENDHQKIPPTGFTRAGDGRYYSRQGNGARQLFKYAK